MNWPRHLLDVDELELTDLEAIMREAEAMRELIRSDGGSVGRLGGRQVALLFAEPSTRTRLSFEVAARRLGAQTYLFEPMSSSMVKGETLADTVRNLDAIGFDMLVVRHHRSGAPWVAARYFGGSVVNAGDGWHAHPTQALLDLFTLKKHFDQLRGRKIAIVGDVLHSRVARSNVRTLTVAGADVWLCGPKHWLRGLDRLPATLTTDLDAALRDAEAVIGLRVQKERMSGSALSLDEYVSRYQITEARLSTAAPNAVYLHPGPINEGVEVTREVARGPRSLVLQQARNGVPVRMAVLAMVGASPRRATPLGQTSSAMRDLSSAIR
jgi:aspartate carbamoyltransferase catalytic subunit